MSQKKSAYTFLQPAVNTTNAHRYTSKMSVLYTSTNNSEGKYCLVIVWRYTEIELYNFQRAICVYVIELINWFKLIAHLYLFQFSYCGSIFLTVLTLFTNCIHFIYQGHIVCIYLMMMVFLWNSLFIFIWSKQISAGLLINCRPQKKPSIWWWTESTTSLLAKEGQLTTFYMQQQGNDIYTLEMIESTISDQTMSW